MSSEHMEKASRFYRVLMQQVIFGMTFYLARSVRRATQATLERARSDDQKLRQREAQLIEAKVELDRALRPGEGRLSGQVLDRYRIGNLLGRGGMGEVYAAEEVGSQPSSRSSSPQIARDGAPGHVAIKVLHPNMLADPANVQRFLREARAAAAVPCEHVAQVLSMGTDLTGVPYLVMELLEGHDLAFYLRRTPQLPLRQVVEMVDQTSRALAALRDAGIVHRDLKPENIFLSQQGGMKDYVKVLDFGLAKVTEREMRPGSVILTQEGMVFGTPEFMSPEQAQGKALTPGSDIYSLAVILYEVLTGKLPFDAKSPMEHIQLHVTTKPKPINERVPGRTFPPLLWTVLSKALEKRSEDRYGSAAEFAHALLAVLQGLPEVPPFMGAQPRALAPSTPAILTPLAQPPVVALPPAGAIPAAPRSSPLPMHPQKAVSSRPPIGLLIGIAFAFLLVGAALAAIVLKLVMK